MTIVISLIIAGVLIAGAAYYFLVIARASVFERALSLAEKGAYTDARGLIRSRIDREPDDFRAHYCLARVYALEGNDESELAHLKEIKRINQFTPEIGAVKILNRMGEILYEQQRYRESFENYLDAATIASNNEQALTFLAFMAAGQGEFDMADRFFKRLVKVAPNVAEYHLARGVCLAMLKNRESLNELEMGLALSPHDITARFLCAFQSFKLGVSEKAIEHVEELVPIVNDGNILHMVHKVAVGSYYIHRDYDKALNHAEHCLANALSENWQDEEYDARLSSAYMAMLVGDLEKANDNLLELEIRNPTDDLILRVADFRMDLEEGVTSADRVSPRGFDFSLHLQDWVRDRFPEDAIYSLSGLKMEDRFDLMDFFMREGGPRTPTPQGPDPAEAIATFNELRGPAFVAACEKIVQVQGFSVQKTLPVRDKDGADFIARNNADRKTTALIRIRQWDNQPISDIFLRNMQNTMNELKVNQGYVIAGARLTSGAETALNNLKKITVINEHDFGDLLRKILK